ncbi:histidine phosphatase family protein [Gracilibacillus kekensis]|uniref:2,3-bisphosphoglycerate-dependent phosphoglycerate mutase n=1 Tax=Gracilibacillus kekensis TaxID=1027249 RepID=A0A1M7J085_9BACI|nr:histidine phosphatase family protein [Gracilibacillus kekensis]SHM46416.1 2,3-bisphosphoglycerate-dependent phosphoglycerate mutase [Gracilibacillus kekensis]
MTSLYFVRHAHSFYTPDELGRPLSDRGFADATIVNEILKAEKIDIVLSSPYKRAIQTIEGVAAQLGKEVIIIEEFKERLLTTSPVTDFDLAVAKVWEDFSFFWDGGESNKDAQKRGVDATYTVLDKYADKNIVIGTHGNIMALIMNHFDFQYDFTFWKNLDMPNVYKLTFDGRGLRGVNRLWNRL